MELHDLRHSKVKAGGKLSDAPELSKGILFSTYDLLIAGKTRAPKPKTVATPGSAAMGGGAGSSPAPLADTDLGSLEFGECSTRVKDPIFGLLHTHLVSAWSLYMHLRL